MIAVRWRFKVRPGREEEFLRAYGPDGEWARLFSVAEGYIGTELDEEAPGVYVTTDRWTTSAARDRFLRAHVREYEELDKRCERLTEKEEALGLGQ